MNTSTLFDLAGRVAIVTGGNGGIGRGIALGFASAGAAVAIIAAMVASGLVVVIALEIFLVVRVLVSSTAERLVSFV